MTAALDDRWSQGQIASKTADVCRFCKSPLDEEPYRSLSKTVNERFFKDECNACRRDDEREYAGVD